MKFFKYSILAVAALATGFAFTACDDDDDYLPGAESAGVFFPKDNATAYDIKANATSVDVVVSRVGVTSAATYAVDCTTDAEGDLFVFPSSVSFGEGETSTILTIGVKAENFVTDVPYTVTINFGEGVQAYNYGNATQTLKVTLASSWTEWTPFKEGTGTYTYTALFSGDDPGLPISYSENMDDPTQARFKIENWGYGVDFIVNYNPETGYCRVFEQNIGGTVKSGGTDYIVTVMDLYEYTGSEADYGTASYFDDKNGVFYLYVIYCAYDPSTMEYAGYFGYDYEVFAVNGYADYSVEVSYSGLFTNAGGTESAAVIQTVTSSDVEEVRVAISNTLDANSLKDAILADAVEYTTVGNGTQECRIPVAGEGDYIAVAVSYANGEAQSAGACKFTIAGGGVASWKPVCYAEFVDAWCCPAFNFTFSDGTVATLQDLMWYVEVQENTQEPGQYRLIDPWHQEGCALYYNDLNSNDVATDLYINATNKDNVKIVPQYSGYTYKDKDFYISNYGGYAEFVGKDDSWAIEKGVNTPWDDGYLQINPALFGYSLDDFGYNWKSNPTAEIFFDFESGYSAPAKVKGSKTLYRAGSAARIEAAVKSDFRIDMTTSPRLRQGRPTITRLANPRVH